jgi:hypothetical protein
MICLHDQPKVNNAVESNRCPATPIIAGELGGYPGLR